MFSKRRKIGSDSKDFIDLAVADMKREKEKRVARGCNASCETTCETSCQFSCQTTCQMACEVGDETGIHIDEQSPKRALIFDGVSDDIKIHNVGEYTHLKNTEESDEVSRCPWCLTKIDETDKRCEWCKGVL